MSNLTTTAVGSNVHGGSWSKAAQDLFTLELEPQVFKQLFQQDGGGYKMLDFMDACGYVGTVSARSLTILEEGVPDRVVTLGANVSTGAAGADFTFTLAAGDYDANGNSILRDGDEIVVPGAYQTGGEDRNYRVTRSGSAGAYTYTAKPFIRAGTNVAAARIGTLIPAGTELIIISNAHGIGTGQPEGKTDGLYSYSFLTKIIKDAYALEGGQQSLARYTDNMAGVDWSSQDARAYLQMIFSHRSKIDGAIFKSEENDNTTLTATSNFGGTHAIPSFVGIWDSFVRRAQQLNFVTNPTWDDVADLRVALLSQGVTSPDVAWLVGHKLNRDLEDLGLDVIKEFSGGTDLTKGMEKVGTAFKAFTRNGLNIVLSELASLSNPRKLGNASYTFAESGLVIPTNQVSVTNAVTGSKVKLNHFMKLDYAGNGENRGMMVGTVAGVNGMGEPFQNQYDGKNVYVASEFMIASAATNQCVLTRPA